MSDRMSWRWRVTNWVVLVAMTFWSTGVDRAWAAVIDLPPAATYPGQPLPVDLKRGALVLPSEDLRVGQDRLPLEVFRIYRSDLVQAKPGLFGWKWHTLADMTLVSTPTGLHLVDEVGRVRDYVKTAGGSYESTRYDYEVIRQSGNGEYIRQLKSGATYHFGKGGFLTEVRDPNGRFIRITHTQVDKGTSVRLEDRYGRQITMTLNTDGRVIRMFDTAGRQCLYGYDKDQNLIGFTNRGGGQLTMAYDAEHRITGVLGGPVQYRVAYRCDRIASQSTQSGVIAEYEYSVQNTGTTLQLKNAAGVITRIVYGGDGSVTVTDPTGVQETISLNARELPVKAAGATGRNAEITYDGHANVVSVTENGVVTKFVYGSDDTLQKVEAATGQSAKFAYDTHRNVTRIENQRGAVSTFEWDENGQLIAVKSPTGQSAALAYDQYGQVRELTTGDGQTIKCDFTKLGVLRGLTTPTGVEISYRYDPLDRLIGVENSEGQKVSLVRDVMGQVIRVVDPAGNKTTMDCDPSGLLTAVHDPVGATTKLAHDQLGRVTALTDANDNTTQWTHDPSGRLLGEVDAFGKAAALKYDGKGLLQEQVNRRGQKTSFSYDATGKLASRDLAGDTAEFNYDSFGRLIRMKDSDSDYSFTFTKDGLLERVADGITGIPVSYQYDAAGRRVKMQAGDDVVRYSYDTHGRLSAIEASVGKIIFEYDQFGRRSAMLYPNGVKTSYSYDKLNRVTEIRAIAKDGKDVTRYRYAYDIRGNRIQIIEGENKITKYEYDAKGQLTTVTQGTNVTEYAYDPVGNRLSVTANGVKEAYATGKDNQLLKAGKSAFEYDADGNMTSRTTPDGKRYEHRYNAANRMVEATGPDGKVSYGYAPNGARVSRTEAGKSASRFVLDQADAVAELADGKTSVLYLHGTGIDEPLAQRSGDATLFYQSDGLGSITGLTDAKGVTAGRYTYDAFGQPQHDENSVANPYRYTGREWDGTANCFFYRARFYMPDIGRFTTHDPLGLSEGANQFAYCANNPIVFTDPLGLFNVTTSLGGIGNAVVDFGKSFIENNPQMPFAPGGYSVNVSALSTLHNAATVLQLVGLASQVGDTFGGWQNVGNAYRNAGSNLSWWVSSWSNFGEASQEIVYGTAAYAINILPSFLTIPGTSIGISSAYEAITGKEIPTVHPDEVVPDIENGYMNAIYWAGDKLSDFYSLFNGPAPGTVAHYSGIANSTVAYYGAPATGSGVSFLGSGSGWNNPPVFSPIPMSQETVPLLLPPATPPPKTTDNPSSSTGGTVTKPSQGSSGKGGVWIK